VYICTQVCIYEYMGIYMYIRRWECRYIGIGICIGMSLWIHIRVQAWMCMQGYIHVYAVITYIWVYGHVCRYGWVFVHA